MKKRGLRKKDQSQGEPVPFRISESRKWYLIIGISLALIFILVSTSIFSNLDHQLLPLKASPLRIDPKAYPLAECSDNIDNDDDGLIDYPNDPDCSSSNDKTENFYKICTPQDLDNIRIDLAGNYEQVCDIDLASYDFEPIEHFGGIYDGNNHKIINFNYNDIDKDYVGLFGLTEFAQIKNIKLENVDIIGKDFVGGLVGYGIESGFSHVSVSGSITGNNSVGGIIGKALYSRIIWSYSIGTVTGLDSVNSGGIVGDLESSEITNSYSTASVSGTGVNTNEVGGLIGSAYQSNVTNCYSTGPVTGKFRVGGLIGEATRSYITNCSSISSVTGYGDEEHHGSDIGGLIGVAELSSNIINSSSSGFVRGNMGIGGLVGQLFFESLVINSYSTSRVNGSTNIGGLIGIDSGWNLVTNSYSTGEVSGDINVGGLIGLYSSTGDYDYNDDIISGNSYSTSSVTGNINVGGLIGSASNSGGSNFYSTGRVSGNSSVGGLIGGGFDETVNITNSYWDINSSGQTQSSYGEGRTTEEMTSVPRPENTYIDWNFENIWNQIDGEYPWLQWQDEF